MPTKQEQQDKAAEVKQVRDATGANMQEALQALNKAGSVEGAIAALAPLPPAPPPAPPPTEPKAPGEVANQFRNIRANTDELPPAPPPAPPPTEPKAPGKREGKPAGFLLFRHPSQTHSGGITMPWPDPAKGTRLQMRAGIVSVPSNWTSTVDQQGRTKTVNAEDLKVYLEGQGFINASGVIPQDLLTDGVVRQVVEWLDKAPDVVREIFALRGVNIDALTSGEDRP